jgi:hypothetical protein
MRLPTRRARQEARRAASSRRSRVCQRVVAALERCVVVESRGGTITDRRAPSSIPATTHPFPIKEDSACLGLTHTGWHPPHLMRTLPTATLVAALPEQWVIIAEPSGLAVACRAARELAEAWLRTQPRLTDGGFVRVFLLRAECARVACA